jgi:hypothetical protein
MPVVVAKVNPIKVNLMINNQQHQASTTTINLKEEHFKTSAMV